MRDVQIIIFLDYTNNGTAFVYGFVAAPPPEWKVDSVFAFSVGRVLGR
jgi:hypothetical protein